MVTRSFPSPTPHWANGLFGCPDPGVLSAAETGVQERTRPYWLTSPGTPVSPGFRSLRRACADVASMRITLNDRSGDRW